MQLNFLSIFYLYVEQMNKASSNWTFVYEFSQFKKKEKEFFKPINLNILFSRFSSHLTWKFSAPPVNLRND